MLNDSMHYCFRTRQGLIFLKRDKSFAESAGHTTSLPSLLYMIDVLLNNVDITFAYISVCGWLQAGCLHASCHVPVLMWSMLTKSSKCQLYMHGVGHAWTSMHCSMHCSMHAHLDLVSVILLIGLPICRCWADRLDRSC